MIRSRNELEYRLVVLLSWYYIPGAMRLQVVCCEPYPVVVHNGVHAFDPIGIEVTVEHYPLRRRVGDGSEVSHDRAQQAIFPLSGSERNVSVEVFGSHRLRVDVDVLH